MTPGGPILPSVLHFLRRSPSDRGAAAVEFALLFGFVFVPLVMGTIAVATAFSRQINITQSAREASRYGATYDIKSAGGVGPWLSAVDTAVRGAAGDPANPIAGYTHRCVAYVRTKTSKSVPPVTAVDMTNSQHMEDGVIGSGPCPKTKAPLIPDSEYVQVVLTRDTRFFMVFANPTLQLDARSVTPYEGETP